MIGYRVWTCEECNAELPESVYPCPMCQEMPKPQPPPPANSYLCEACTFQNHISNHYCEMCGKPREADGLLHVPKPVVGKKSAVTCPHCSKDNDLGN